MTTLAQTRIAGRVAALDWDGLGATLDESGFAVTPPLLGAAECRDLAALFDGGRFRSTVDMARHRFGDGRCRCFDHPLPAPIGELRSSFYERLAPIANDWWERLGEGPGAFPLAHEELLARCRAAASAGRPRSSCATARATGTPCQRTCTAPSTSRSRR